MDIPTDQVDFYRDLIRSAAQSADTNGNGFLEPEELIEVLRATGQPNLSTDDVEAFIKSYDTNGDGRIDYEEFIKIAIP